MLGHRALPHRDAGADEVAHEVVAEGVGLHGRDEHAVGVAPPGEVLELADGGRVVAVPAVGGPVVQPHEARGRRAHQVEVEQVVVPERVAAPRRVALGPAVGDAVLVAPPERAEARVEARRRESRPGDDDLVRGAGQPVQAPGQDGRGVERRPVDHAAVRPLQLGDLLVRQVEVHHLAARVDAGVGAAGDRDGRDVLVTAEERAERRLHLALDRAPAGLLAPARERGAVVGRGQPHPGQARLHEGRVVEGRGVRHGVDPTGTGARLLVALPRGRRRPRHGLPCRGRRSARGVRPPRRCGAGGRGGSRPRSAARAPARPTPRRSPSR